MVLKDFLPLRHEPLDSDLVPVEPMPQVALKDYLLP